MRKTLQTIVWAFLKVIVKVFMRVELQGLENIQNLSGPAILVSNHISLLDFLVTGGSLPLEVFLKVRVIAKVELVSVPLLKQFFGLFNVIIIDKKKPRAALRESVEVLKSGGIIGIYPEGGTSPDGNLMPFNGGSQYLINKSDALVVPIIIQGLSRTGRGFRVVLGCVKDFFTRGYKVRVVFGVPMNTENLADDYRQFYDYTRR